LVRGEDIDDTVDRRRGRVCMQRGKGQVTGLRNSKRGLSRLEIAHFSDQHHVGILTKGGAKRVCKRMCVGVYFALIYDAAFMRVKILDGIFDGDDVFVAVAVY